MNQWKNSKYNFEDKVKKLEDKKNSIKEKNGDILTNYEIHSKFGEDVTDAIIKDNINEKALERKNVLDKYYRLKNDMFSFSINEIESLARNLVEWADEENENFIIKSFFSQRLIPQSVVNELINSNEFFKNCYEIACDRCESKLIENSMMVGSSIKGNMAQFILGNEAIKKVNNKDFDGKNRSEKEMGILHDISAKLDKLPTNELENLLLENK